MSSSSPVRRVILALLLALCPAARAQTQSIARIWSDEILAAIRIDLPHPPVHARNLFHLSAAMYDAWAAYDPVPAGYIYHAKHTAADVAAARREAISRAAYRILSERYAFSRNAATTLPVLRARLSALGYDPDFTGTNPATPGGLGNAVAAAVSAFALEDGSRQTASPAYADWPADQGGYVYVNPVLVVADPGTFPVQVNRWQRLQLVAGFSQNGLPIPATQSYLGPHWREVRPFALTRADPALPWLDPGAPPLLSAPLTAALRDNVVGVITAGSQLDPADGVRIDISPGAMGNSPLGTNDGAGHALNPATGLPYAANSPLRGDFARVLAEYWADGPNSETPPGHWNSIANAVAAHPDFDRRLEGAGAALDPLEWDVKMYFALNAALHDAACAAWTLKRHYDGWRPIAMIRYMAMRGQSTNPAGPAYHALGLPLVPGLIEVVTAASSSGGGPHVGLTPGKVAVRAWPGQPGSPATQTSGVRWVHGDSWVPFQSDTFVTPAFPGYVSGHSTFSRAAAQVLAAMTGSGFFPGGLAVFTAPANQFLRFERGPSETVTLQWATYFDAADQAGLSRIWGGIHPTADDLSGRTVGAAAGSGAWALARRYWDGSVRGATPELIALQAGPPGWTVRWDSLRGRRYRIEAAEHPAGPWTSLASATATDTASERTITPTGPTVILRAVHEP